MELIYIRRTGVTNQKKMGLENMTFREALEKRSKNNPEKTFICFEDKEITNREVDTIANKLAHGLLRLGVKKGDKVCLFLPNRPEFLYAYFANAKIGSLNVVISPRYTAREVTFFVNHSEANTVFTTAALLDTIRGIRAECPHLRNVICIDDVSVPDALSFATVIKGAPSNPPAIDVWGEDLAGIQYTSGTSSGVPKGVLYTNESFSLSCKGWIRELQVPPESRLITVSQFVHANGVIAILMALLSGASLVFPEEFSASKFWDLVERWQPTHFVTVATFLAILLTLPKTPKEASNSLTVIGGAGGASRMYHQIKERFQAEVFDFFAMTETAGTATPIPVDGKYKVGSARNG